MAKWRIKKSEVKEALVNYLFGYPDNNSDWYDLTIKKDGTIELMLNAKGFYHCQSYKPTKDLNSAAI